MYFSCVNIEIHHAKGSGLAPWPKRLTAPPPRLVELGISEEDFVKDTVILLNPLCSCSFFL
jgi:hypothetical protein